jgi:hypothetical protein
MFGVYFVYNILHVLFSSVQYPSKQATNNDLLTCRLSFIVTITLVFCNTLAFHISPPGAPLAVEALFDNEVAA